MPIRHVAGGASGKPARSALRVLVLIALLARPGSVGAFPEGGATPSPTPSPSPTPLPHEVKIINRCSQPVWIGANGDASLPAYTIPLAPRCTDTNAATVCPSQTCSKGACTCQGDADCTFDAAGPTTATCDTNTNRCVTRTRIAVPGSWQGRIWARTGCSGSSTDFVCASGQCGPATGGNMNCETEGAYGSLATLFELTAVPAPGLDNFDVSLVSGYNVPLTVKVKLPPDAPVWKPSTSYGAGAEIVERTRRGIFGFTNAGAGGTSGSSKPGFPFKYGHEVTDAAGVIWRNTGPRCADSGCDRGGLRQEACPTQLQVLVGGEYVACNVPDQVCSPSDPNCSLYLCKNAQSGAPTDLFGEAITLASANGASAVCYSPDDCRPGSHCLVDPVFDSASTQLMPSGTGVCMPIAQDGGCTGANTPDGEPCPSINFPFVNATCHTVKGARVCLPSLDSGNQGLGDLWWNAENWTDQSTSCTSDAGCSGGQKCFEAVQNFGLKECTGPGDTCTCFASSTCTSGASCSATGSACLDAGVSPCSGGTCYCYPQAVYSGACGASNQGWLDAATAISNPPDATWPQGFRAACPVAYGYQFDDPASNWFCPNGTVDGSNGYRVVLCGPSVK